MTVVSEIAAESCGNVSGIVQQTATASITPSASATESAEFLSSSSINHTSTGAIAGATVGGVAFVAAAVFAAFLSSRKRRQRQGHTRHELPAVKSALDGLAIKPEEAGTESTGGILVRNLASSNELDSTKPLSELPPYGSRLQTEGGRNNYPMQKDSHAAHEMDGRVYTFQP